MQLAACVLLSQSFVLIVNDHVWMIHLHYEYFWLLLAVIRPRAAEQIADPQNVEQISVKLMDILQKCFLCFFPHPISSPAHKPAFWRHLLVHCW